MREFILCSSGFARCDALLLQHWPSCTCQDAQAWIAPACAFLRHLGLVHKALPRRAIPGPQQQPSAACTSFILSSAQVHAFEVSTLLKVLVLCLEGGKTTNGIYMMLDILDYDKVA